jgi:antitoxin component YwqK of YwqJK toxin-antitoxin module
MNEGIKEGFGVEFDENLMVRTIGEYKNGLLNGIAQQDH